MPPKKDKTTLEETRNPDADIFRDSTVVEALGKALGSVLAKQVEIVMQQNFQSLNETLIKLTQDNLKLQNEVQALKEENKMLISKISEPHSQFIVPENRSRINLSSINATNTSNMRRNSTTGDSAVTIAPDEASNHLSIVGGLRPSLFSSLAAGLPPNFSNSKQYFPPKKIISVGETSENCKLKSALPLQRKFILHLDNLSEEVTDKDITDYAKNKGVQILSIFPKKSWVSRRKKPQPRTSTSEEDEETGNDTENENEDTSQIKSFRVAISLKDKVTCMGAEFWPRSVIIRPWKWQQKQDEHKNPTQNGGES